MLSLIYLFAFYLFLPFYIESYSGGYFLNVLSRYSLHNFEKEMNNMKKKNKNKKNKNKNETWNNC